MTALQEVKYLQFINAFLYTGVVEKETELLDDTQ
jgi:hypothetical protein